MIFPIFIILSYQYFAMQMSKTNQIPPSPVINPLIKKARIHFHHPHHHPVHLHHRHHQIQFQQQIPVINVMVVQNLIQHSVDFLNINNFIAYRPNQKTISM